MKNIKRNNIIPCNDKSGNMQEVFDDLAMMLWKETESPVWNRGFFDGKRMDLSVDSLNHLDEYLLSAFDPTTAKMMDTEMFLITFLRTGAYFGEVLSKNSIFTFEWISYREAAERNIEFPEPLTPFDGSSFLHRTGHPTNLFPYTTVRKTLYSRRAGKIISLRESAEKILELLRSPNKNPFRC